MLEGYNTSDILHIALLELIYLFLSTCLMWLLENLIHVPHLSGLHSISIE